MPKMQNQKYLMKVDLGGGQYRYLYTQEEVAAYKAGKTGGNQSHGEDHYQYQAHRQKGGRELARENQLKLAPKNHSGDTSSSRYSYQRTKNTTSGGRITGTRTGIYNGVNSSEPQITVSRDRYGTRKRQLVNAPENHSSQRGYTYQTKRNAAGVAETRTVQPTGRTKSKVNVDRTKTPGYRTQTNKNQLQSAPKNSGGVSSSDNYRYMSPSLRLETKAIPTKQKLKGKGSATVTSYDVKNGSGHNYTNGKKNVVPKNNSKTEYHDSKTTKKVKNAVSNAKSSAKSATKKIAKGYDNATTKIADKAVKATPKAKKAIKSAAKNYDNATTKMANAAWNATHSKAAQNAKKTVSSGAKKASNALTKAWNNLFKKKKK